MTPLWEPDRILREIAAEQRWMAYMDLYQVGVHPNLTSQITPPLITPNVHTCYVAMFDGNHLASLMPLRQR